MFSVKFIVENTLSIEKPIIEQWCKNHNIEYQDIVAVVSENYLRQRIYKIITAAKDKPNSTTKRTDIPYIAYFFGQPREAKMFVYQKLEGDDK